MKNLNVKIDFNDVLYICKIKKMELSNMGSCKKKTEVFYPPNLQFLIFHYRNGRLLNNSMDVIQA